MIRRNTSDGGDSGWLTLAGGGGGGGSGQDNSRGGWINVLGAESTATFGFSGVDIGIGASAGTAKMLVRRTDGTNSFEILGSDGSATFTSSANDDVWNFNSTAAGGGEIVISRSGTVRGRLGTEDAVDDGASADDLMLKATSALRLKSGTSVFVANITTGSNDNYLCFDTGTNKIFRQGSACSVSSLRFKENIQDLNYGLSEVLELRPISFEYKSDNQIDPESGVHIGFIAEEMELVIPEVITYTPEGVVQGIDYPVLTSLLAKAIQEIAQISGVFKDTLIAWLGDATNGIENIFAKKATLEEICLKDTNGTSCYTRNQLDTIIAGAGMSSSSGSSGESENEAVSVEDSGEPMEETASSTPETATSTDESITEETAPIDEAQGEQADEPAEE